ncbi:hypothetical protein MRX96_006801 [Rhipicephalus microplus]
MRAHHKCQMKRVGWKLSRIETQVMVNRDEDESNGAKENDDGGDEAGDGDEAEEGGVEEEGGRRKTRSAASS